MNEITSQKVTIGVVAFLLGMAFYWMFLGDQGASSPPLKEDEAPLATPAADQSSDDKMAEESAPEKVAEESEKSSDYTLTVIDQVPDKSVTIAKLVTPTTIWLGIHDDQKGKPGKVLGARRFRKGEYANQLVQLLLEPMKAGGAYYAIILKDDGDNTFDYTKDTPLHDEGGNLIMTTFKASASN